MHLPGLSEFIRAMPNHLARSSLFAPVKRGRRSFLDKVQLVSRGDATITFTGKQLDESLADVWMQALYEAQRAPLGEDVRIRRADFLVAIGRGTGKSQYDWLQRAMDDLMLATLTIELRNKDGERRVLGAREALHLVDAYRYDDSTETYVLRLNPRWIALYAGNRFSLIDWDKRLQFGAQQDMAKSLQRLIATSNEREQRYALDWLKARMSFSGRMRDFKVSLSGAFRELERLRIITDGRIEPSSRGSEQAVWNRL